MKNVFEKLKITDKGGLTTREFLLVIFLIIAVEGYLLYAYVLQPAYIEYASVVEDRLTKQATLDGLIKDYARKDEMEKEIASLENEISEMEKQIPSYLSQEEIILFINSTSQKNTVIVQGITFTNVNDIPLKTISAGDESAMKDNTSAGTEPVVIEQLAAINYICGYQDLYSFIKDVENSTRKISVKGVVAQKGNDGMMTGQVLLSFTSYWDKNDGQKPYIMTTNQIPGKTDLFKEFEGFSSSGSASSGSETANTSVKPDFYLMINSYLNNSAKTLLLNYYDKGSEAAADKNEVVAGQMTINGKDGNYTYQYNFGGYNITGDNPTPVKDGKIRMEVLVQQRRSDEDRVGVMLDITNNSDVPFEVEIKGDDAANPRFVRGKTSGNVIVKQVK